MATFTATAIGSPIPNLNQTRSSEKLFLPISVSTRRTQSPGAPRFPVVVAMGGGGGPKFKGTQMREKKLTEMIENMVMEAKEVCAGDETSEECRVAWDDVEEVSQAKAHLRIKLEHREDPLESFCSENPETDECTVYDD